MDIKLSFVIPVYNVERYLDQCLSSLLSKSTPAVEVVMVDDGSKDRSPQICDEYCARYSNARVVHIPNGGNSAARNLGVEMARGEYICFVDSDDFIHEDAVPKILKWMETCSADICFLQATKYFPDGSTIPLGEGLVGKKLRGKTREQALAYMATCPKYPGGPWAKILRREFLLQNGIRFPSDRRLCEDLFYTLDIYMAADSFDALEFPYYYYRQNVAGSITSNVTARYYFDKARFVTHVVEQFTENGKPLDGISESALSFAAYEYSILIWHLLCMKDEDHARALQFLKDYRWILNWGKSSKTKFVKTVVDVFGLTRTAGIMDVYMRNR